jgi:hypothetical protein
VTVIIVIAVFVGIGRLGGFGFGVESGGLGGESGEGDRRPQLALRINSPLP